MRRPTSIDSRRAVASLLAVTAAALIACAPPEGLPGPTSTIVAQTTTTVAPPPAPPTCTVPTSSSSSVVSPTSSAGPSGAAEGPPILTDSADITTAAEDAVRDAARVGADEVTVVAVDDVGRPTLVPAPLDEAVATALATAESLGVVAVEVPAVARALDDASTGAGPGSSDPLVGQQWAQSAFAFSSLWPCGRGAGISVAVVDTGVQADHPDLTGRVTPGVAFQNGGPEQPGAGGTDPNGHGTHVAGIIGAGVNGVGIVGVAPEVTILPVRVLGTNGSGANSDISRGITWAVDHGANIINISIGSDVNSPSVSTAVSYATTHGVVVVAAAGNGGAGGAPRYPAALPEVIAVGALSKDLSIAGYSTNGDYLDVAAPGSGILSTVPPSDWANNSGTSMASPHVAGLAALVIDGRGPVTPAAMLTRLTSTATDAGPRGFDPAYGWGRIDPVAALNAP